MKETSLFLGILLSNLLQEGISSLPTAERDLFIQDCDSPYLQRVEIEGTRYLGKYLGLSIEMGQLDSTHAHILSLLRKLVPQHPFAREALQLIVVET